MGDKKKKLCKWSEKEIGKQWKTLAKSVDPPRYICTKCARVAAGKACLCKPVERPSS